MAYADILELKAALGITDTVDDALLALALGAATQAIDAFTGRRFSLDAAAVTRVYVGDASNTIYPLDLVTITSIKVDTAGNRGYAKTLNYATQEYERWPLNGARFDRLTSGYFTPGAYVQVVGTYGYVEGGAAPDAVRQACIIQASRLYKRREAPFGILQTVDLGQYTRISKTDPDVEALLAPYKVGSTVGWVVA